MPFRRRYNRRGLKVLQALCVWSVMSIFLFWWRTNDGAAVINKTSGIPMPVIGFQAVFDGYSEWEENSKQESDFRGEEISVLREIVSENLFSGFAEDGMYSLFAQPIVPSQKKEKAALDYGHDGDVDIEGVSDYMLWYENFQTENLKAPSLPRQQRCASSVQNIAFLKTHFTGSDVITNILNRYGDLNNLHVALPNDGLSTFYWPMRFQWKYIDITLLNGSLPNIIANHARYNNDVMDNILNPGSVYVTILRDPASQLETTFRNLGFAELLDINATDALDAFLRDPKSYIQNVIKRKQFKDTLNLIKNGQFFDLGLATTEYHRKNIIAASIQELYERFTIVLIYEHLDESLVLMKRRLCWSLDDIIYLKVHHQTHDIGNRVAYTDDLRDMIRMWNSADTSLYNFFNKTLWQEIGYEGPSFWREVQEFRILLRQMEDECISVNPIKRDNLTADTQQSGADIYSNTNNETDGDSTKEHEDLASRVEQREEQPHQANPVFMRTLSTQSALDGWHFRRKLLASGLHSANTPSKLGEGLRAQQAEVAHLKREQVENVVGKAGFRSRAWTGRNIRHVASTPLYQTEMQHLLANLNSTQPADYRPSRYRAMRGNHNFRSTLQDQEIEDITKNPSPWRSEENVAQKYPQAINNSSHRRLPLYSLTKGDVGSGHIQDEPIVDSLQRRIDIMLHSQVSAWNRYFCKKLVTTEAEYLDYFRRKHAYEKLATKT